MKEINLWESKFNDDYLFFNTIQDYFKYLENNKIDMDFRTKESYTPGEDTESMLDNSALRNNIKINYTDNLHPIAISKNSFQTSYINPTFFDQHKDEFIKYAKDKFTKELNNNKSIIYIPNFIFSSELVNEIINSRNKYANFTCQEYTDNLEINEELRKIIKDNHLEFSASYRHKPREEISTKYIIGYNSLDDLKNIISITIKLPIDDDKINNFIHINPDGIINLNYNIDEINESDYYKQILHIFDIIKTHNKKYNININVVNRTIFKESNLINNIPANITLQIFNDLYKYDKDTYISEETKLDKLVEPIKNASLSPLEKYLAVYDIVKKFKPYNENEENPHKARNLRYLLDDNNEYIVCVGFAKLLNDLLNRVGIPNKKINVSPDISYDDGFTLEEKKLDHVGHARNLVKIDDDKYNIHGYYLADSTWDNDMDNDLYLNSLLTFDRKKEAKRLEKLTDEDLLLDFS